jgi:hypothetical protein
MASSLGNVAHHPLALIRLALSDQLTDDGPGQGLTPPYLPVPLL